METPEIVKQARQKRMEMEARLQANLAGQRMRDLLEETEQRNQDHVDDMALASDSDFALVTNEGGKVIDDGEGDVPKEKERDSEPLTSLIPSKNNNLENSMDQGKRQDFCFGSIHSIPQNISVIQLPKYQQTQATPQAQNQICPSIHLSSEEINHAHAQWSSSIIIRLVGCFIDQTSLINKLMATWKLRAEPNIINIEKGKRIEAIRKGKVIRQSHGSRDNASTSVKVKSSLPFDNPKSNQLSPEPKEKGHTTAAPKNKEIKEFSSQTPILSPNKATPSPQNTSSPPCTPLAEASKVILKPRHYINTTIMALPNPHLKPPSESLLENHFFSQDAKTTSIIASKPQRRYAEKSKPKIENGTEAENPIRLTFQDPNNHSTMGFFQESTDGATPLSNQSSKLQHQDSIPLENMVEPYDSSHFLDNLVSSMGTSMLESQLLQVREHAVKELMTHLRDNGQALLFPLAIIQTSPTPIDPQMNNELFNSNQLLQVINLDLFTALSTYQGNLPQGALLYTSSSIQAVDTIVTSSLSLETGCLEYHLKFSPTPSLRYTRKFYMDDSPHYGHYINPEIEESVSTVGHDEVEIDKNMTPINIPEWNARGAASAEFRRAIIDLKTRHLPRVVFITETRVGGIRAKNIIRSIGYDGFYKVDPMGYAGGLWLLWDSAFVKMDIHGNSFQGIQTII
ncbi:reverse transcriptase [Senna tora]|uniref:Reverse transcriptase n=1 Tax=Senna tora TaxID=362788 RepID=A0A834SWV8_9FABA|nr:reverse transcriptase [Senna tora]